MSESTDFVKTPNVINATQSGAGNVQTIIPILGRRTISLAEITTGTLTSSVQVWTSGDYSDPGNGDPAGVTAAEARATWNLLAAAGGLTQPAGSPVDSRVVLSVCDAAIRIRSTWTSGSGTIQIHYNAQSN